MLKLAFLACALTSYGFILPDLNSQLSSRYSKWDAAYRANDAKAMVFLLHRRFRIVTQSGNVMSGTDYVKGLGKGKAPEVYETTLLKAKRTRSKAYAWTREIA